MCQAELVEAPFHLEGELKIKQNVILSLSKDLSVIKLFLFNYS
jgi:hypothetical protein